MVSIVTGIIGLLAAGLIILLIRKDKLHVTHGVGWMMVAVGFVLLGFAPGIIDMIARYLGVSYPPILALTLGIVVLVVKILLMDIERSHIEMRNQRLIQRVAMLETDLRNFRQSREDSSTNTHQQVKTLRVNRKSSED
jgi:hypothetical protein